MSLMNRKRGLTGLTAAPVVTTLFCAAAFMATAAVATPQAADSINVSYVADDLRQPEAAQTLYGRIQRAAKMVCHEPDIRDLASYAVYQQCYARAVDEAVAKVGATALTALHRSKTQRSAAG